MKNFQIISDVEKDLHHETASEIKRYLESHEKCAKIVGSSSEVTQIDWADLVTGHVPVREIAQDITKELIMEKLAVFHRSLKEDFGIDSPRIAVFSLNPHAGDEGLIGTEESDIIIPAMKEMVAKGIQCFGPYPADGFMGSGNYTHFDGILAMYHDQGLAPFKALAMDEGVNYTAGLPIVRTSPAHGTAYDIAGQGVALEDSFRQAIYVAMDVFRNRVVEKEIHAHPLRTYGAGI